MRDGGEREREHERKGMEESEKKVGREGWRARQKW